MYGREKKTPVRTENVYRSEKKLSLESCEGKYRLRNDDRACQRTSYEDEQKSIQNKADGAGGRILAFPQGAEPGSIQPCMQQDGSQQQDSKPFMCHIACMTVSHKQKKEKQHECVCQKSCRNVHLRLTSDHEQKSQIKGGILPVRFAEGIAEDLICRIREGGWLMKIRFLQKIA